MTVGKKFDQILYSTFAWPQPHPATPEAQHSYIINWNVGVKFREWQRGNVKIGQVQHSLSTTCRLLANEEIQANVQD